MVSLKDYKFTIIFLFIGLIIGLIICLAISNITIWDISTASKETYRAVTGNEFQTKKIYDFPILFISILFPIGFGSLILGWYVDIQHKEKLKISSKRYEFKNIENVSELDLETKKLFLEFFELWKKLLKIVSMLFFISFLFLLTVIFIEIPYHILIIIGATLFLICVPLAIFITIKFVWPYYRFIAKINVRFSPFKYKSIGFFHLFSFRNQIKYIFLIFCFSYVFVAYLAIYYSYFYVSILFIMGVPFFLYMVRLAEKAENEIWNSIHEKKKKI